jgi:ABC-type transport system involved in multi-copper enzyme maturation permease subunit
MLKLLNIEILKLKRSRSFLIMALLFVVSVFGVNYSLTKSIIVGRGMIADEGLSSKITFSTVWEYVSFATSFLIIIPCFMMIMHTCSEYTWRTHRQNVIDGLSRSQYITGKMLLIILLSLFSTVLLIITTLFVGMAVDVTFTFTGFKYVCYFLIQAIIYTSFSFLFALLFKRTGLAIGTFFVYSFAIENFLEYYINKINIGIEKMGLFLPLAASDYLLIPNALKGELSPVLQKGIGIYSESTFILVSIGYIVLCSLLCYWRYEEQDL